ncbi:alpha/beta-hydrolase [Rickenella mellea]|uniref:Alpha/beta-hydrolase n=1 Tax=Rickenella mellea TaxID=50990 RepID=A0A4Y7QJ25_9AGAM|nr:alpha/beta-hydrolase [Rickenella mellea]
MAQSTENTNLNTIFDPSTCVRKGLCPVTHLRGQDEDPLESHSLYFEQHGNGPEKLVFIMGLNSSSFSWEPQVAHFGRLSGYSVLIFDNRGVGNSTTPKGPYTTAGMAEDVITLLDYIGWTKQKDIHIVGVSLGGMISQELATRIPDRILSLTLVVTKGGGRPWSNLPPWKGLSTLTRLLTIKDPQDKVPFVLPMLFPESWLDEKSPDDTQGRTNREVQREDWLRRATAVRPQTGMGAMSQMAAGLTHHVTPARLNTISKGITKVTIVTGDDDHLVNPANSDYLKKNMPEAEFVKWENTGHGITTQRPVQFNQLVERVVRESRAKTSN